MQHPFPSHSNGSGYPIMLLHSSGLSSQQWRRLVSSLSPKRCVIAHDFLGCGSEPPWPPGRDFSLQQELEGVLARCDTLASPVHLVGHSYGALVALQLARLDPSRVASLALYEPTAFGVLDSVDDEDALDDLVQLAPLFDLSHIPWRMASKRLRSGSWAPPVDRSQIPVGSEEWLYAFTSYWAGEGLWNAMPEETRASFRRAGQKVYLEMRAATLDRVPAAAYQEIGAPTLVMYGARSPAPTRRIASRLAGAMPRAYLREFPTAGHLGPITHASRINGAIEEHLRASEPTP
jgi:pimeloyl-ACP methyl ester carboxylesterase